MKRWIVIAVILGAFVPAFGAGLPMNDLAPSFTVHIPGTGDFDLYKIAYGVELQYRNWAFDPFGWALSVGYERWETDKDCKKLGAIHTDFDGAVTAVPLGISGLFYVFGTPRAELTLEAGLRYMLVSGEVDFIRRVGAERIPSTLEVDDSLVGVLVLDADYLLSDQFALFGGIGYQQDLVRGEITTPTGNLRDNHFSSFFLRLGAKLSF